MKSLTKHTYLLIISLLTICDYTYAKSILYVTENGSGDGSSWNNASGSIQDMIDKSISGDEVWVAKGTYFPIKEMIARNARSKTFLLKEGVNLYGGFSGFETSISQRALSDINEDGVIESYELTNTTCLSGDIDSISDIWIKNFNSDSTTWNFSILGNEGNCGHVVYGSDFTKHTYFDGFTVTSGNADNSGWFPCGGGVYSKSKLFVENCIISYCTTSGNGGGVYFQYDSEIHNSYIYNCSASLNGGGVYSEKMVLGCDISDCSASNSGGGVYLFSQNTIGSISVSNTKIKNCSSSTGGGINVKSYSSIVYLDNCIISNCSASKSGGGMNVSNFSSTLYTHITNCNISNCVSLGDAGGIMAGSSCTSSYIKNCTLMDCISSNNGGGIYSSDYIENCSVDNCKASVNGGGIFSQSIVGKCTINNCSASSGGGIYSNSNVIKCKINNCIAYKFGGGIYSRSSYKSIDYKIYSYISNCVVGNCFASNGGGIYSVSIPSSGSDGNSTLNITNCTVYNCTASNSGGGIYADYYLNNNRSLMYSFVTNCSINNCVASNDGCSIYTTAFARFYSYINKCSTSSYVDNEYKSDIYGGVQSENINPELSTTYIKPTHFVGMTEIDSLQKELIASDWHLCENSQCIDAGIKSEFSDYTDYDGHDRIQGRTIDIGAYEYNSLSTFKTIKMPAIENFDSCTNFRDSYILYDAATIDSYDIKWIIEDNKALFDWKTNLRSYNQAFFTYLIDATDATNVFLEYDMYFKAYSGSITQLGTEKLKVEYSTDLKTWSPVATYSNINGTIENQKYSHDISSIAAGKKFSIRFNANGENSNRIEKWEIDNIEIKTTSTTTVNSPIYKNYLLNVQNDELYISNIQGKYLSIYDTNGRLITEKYNAKESERFSIKKSGIYIVVIDNYIEKIIVN